MKLSIVIPVYNERATLEELVSRVVGVDVGMARQVILVDDGSTDGTQEIYPRIVERWPEEEIIYHAQPNNRGKGAAVREGFRRADGDIVLIQDADLEYHPKDYPRLLQPILDGVADVVYGSRFVGSEAHRVHLFWHMVGNKFITLLSNMFTNLNLTDMETCYKVFRAEVLKDLHLKANRFNFEPEITARIARGRRDGRRWRIYEVGISYAGRDFAEGKKISWRDGIPALWTIVRCRLFDRW
jgi:glycosyltransferase involved in cell wall biosynthesis